MIVILNSLLSEVPILYIDHFGHSSWTKTDVHVFQVATFDRISILTRKVTHQFATTHSDAPLSIVEVSEPCLKTKLLQSIATVTHQVRFFILRPFLDFT